MVVTGTILGKMNFRLLTVDDPAWGEAFHRLPMARQDVFYHPAYARLCQETINRGDRVLCATVETSKGPLLYPFVLRDLTRLTRIAMPTCYDMTGLYGRNGVACDVGVRDDELNYFHDQLAAFATENHVVCSFDRFHPVWANERQAAPDSQIFDVGPFVIVDLQYDIAQIESNYRYSVRKDLKKAAQSGISTFIDTGSAHLGQFISIYNETMERNQAEAFYRRFDAEFFHKVLELLQDHALFIYATCRDHIVACELVLFHGQFGHSFLGGTLQEALPLAANHMLKRELIRELKRRGCRFFLLGGGKKVGDGIERYKRSYSPVSTTHSCVGGRVYNQIALAELRTRLLDAGMSIKTSRIQFYDID